MVNSPKRNSNNNHSNNKNRPYYNSVLYSNTNIPPAYITQSESNVSNLEDSSIMSSKSLLELINSKVHVRSLPTTIKGGQKLYYRSQKLVANKLGTSHSWINEFPHFNELHNIAYDPHEESKLKKLKKVEDYISKITLEYNKINSSSSIILNEKLDDLYQEWIQRHGSIPTLPNSSKKRKKSQLQTNASVDSKTKSTSESSMTPASKAKLEKEERELKELKALKQRYDTEVREIVEGHIPTVYAAPGNPNFQYLANSIRLLSLNRTICFSIDVEAYEFNNNIVTEVGISIYDPRENQDNLVPMTRNYHLIVSESLVMRNKKFVCDFKDCYLMGESIVLSLDQCVEFIQSLINYYMRPATEEDSTWCRAFVGHNVKGDINWLQTMGIQLPNNGVNTDANKSTTNKNSATKEGSTSSHENQSYDSVLDYTLDHFNPNTASTNKKNYPIFMLDTEKLYRCCYGNFGCNLGRILRLFELPHAYLHNAGNDSYYTLRLLLHMCDINFRLQGKLDELTLMAHKIREWIAREKYEPKVLPMSYAISVFEANSKNKTNGKAQDNLKRRRKKIWYHKQ
ncbi:hypothetical protein TBLA_0A07370 [Henningerozyma blattae CBS 6284]|uniref:Gfd2/YDR514C-like C-terminal domain-containing protein n=1 Tax=Henningerozyma blattae (strain ATCC 34711 / CBS 6284 / DSM 70876 / NBRC 10599 / NRRL Y-10934 / UCD 77-7) TaxID=1071380 RepID=I2GWM5_HENB6|nr:hypothetical protein TBLA_0A07370 [Tetrapisispora blattae CBS 6284]CCH58527.1 hypothetical protein TBLA_0A07370 [Tetrapisispora blattae CBS 6284]